MKQSAEVWSYRCKQNWVLKMVKLRLEACDNVMTVIMTMSCVWDKNVEWHA